MTQVILALAVGVFLIVAHRFLVAAMDAFVLGPEGDAGEAEQLLVDLSNKKRLALSNLIETKLDYETHKIARSDYEQIREIERQEAFAVMAEIDEVAATLRFRDQVERDIQSSSVDSSLSRGAPIVLGASMPPQGELSEAARIRQQLRSGASRCPECAVPYDASDAFCRSCGQGLETPGSAP